MSDCVICQAVQSDKLMKLYEDPDVAVMLHPKPATLGHLIIVPKQHYAIIETVPNTILGKAIIVANRFSMFLFEALEAKGTNMIIANGVPAGQSLAHFVINIIPRSENDGLDFQWTPKKSSEQELSDNQSALSSEIQHVLSQPAAAEKMPVKATEEKQEIKVEEKEEKVEHKEEPKHESKIKHLLKYITRIP